MDLPRIDVEWLALKAGYKPAIRLTADPEEAEQMRARLLGWGAKVVRAEGPVGADLRRRSLLYVARSLSDAEALRDAEAPMLVETPKPLALRLRSCLEVGRRLGYPRCCVEVFCERVERGVGVVEAGGAAKAAESYVSARDAWTARPDPLLNTLWLDESIRWITFEPCRFDCALALRLASAVRDFASSKAPVDVATFDHLLRESVVIAPSGARAFVSLSQKAETRITRAWSLKGEARDEALARSVEGKTLDEDGRVIESGEPAVICLDFAALAKLNAPA